mmetsp:Transcript_2662/g.5693  ORF Transcript_2662/g.5693 Transcript_2662/m.5693 type:complete len:211 (-) Transcript_2662:88-720(-)
MELEAARGVLSHPEQSRARPNYCVLCNLTRCIRPTGPVATHRRASHLGGWTLGLASGEPPPPRLHEAAGGETEHGECADEVGRGTDQDLPRQQFLRKVHEEQGHVTEPGGQVQIEAVRAPGGRVAGKSNSGGDPKEPRLVLLGVVDHLDKLLRAERRANSDEARFEEGDAERIHVEVGGLAHAAFLAGANVPRDESAPHRHQVKDADLDG